MHDDESKVTYGVITVLILLLGGIAYILQPTSGMPEVTKQDSPTKVITGTKQTDTTITQTPNQGIAASETQTKPMEEKQYTSATITTNKGTIEIEFGKATPLTVANFGKLASSEFYNGIRFHRVIKGFMIQAGDPLSKDKANIDRWGTGGPGYQFQDELKGNEQYPIGTIAMANSGPNTNGSQFFIVTANPGAPLPPSYTVFGKVTKGIETAMAIESVKTGTADRPVEDVIIEKVEVR